MLLILVVILILLAVGGLPSIGIVPTVWNVGYFPSGAIGIVLLILLVLLIIGKL